MRVRPFKCIVILVKKALGSGIYQSILQIPLTAKLRVQLK